MSNIPQDNVFSFIPLSFEALCNIKAMAVTGPIRPELAPSIIEVEAVKDRDAPENAPPATFRYTLAFPGSGFMRVPFKVVETSPSITPEQLAERGGAVKAVVEGYSGGSFPVDGGGVRPYFKATKITPAPAPGGGTAPSK